VGTCGLALSEILKQLVEPWYRSLDDPVSAQRSVLRELLSGYARTTYGTRHNAASIVDFDDFRKSFPVVSYADLGPEIEEVKRGNYGCLLPEPVVRWVMTRGTTGSPKLFPATETHLSQILAVGARAIVHFILRSGDQSLLDGEVLNLNFPSEVSSFQTQGGEARYGYSSGTYAKLNPSLGTLKLVPRQEEIDALGGGISKSDWEKRFELVYEKAREADVRFVMGVTPVILSFATYLRRKKKVLPSRIWKMAGLFCTSVAKIQTRYAPTLRAMYGQAPVVEMYTATEGVFAQQRDYLPYVSPNYDVYLFEVATRKGTKMLHEMKPREWGRLIVSTPIFPRYDIGDYIEALGKGYYRVIGRAKAVTVAEHVLFNVLTGRFF
jgi:hypothetical protein